MWQSCERRSLKRGEEIHDRALILLLLSADFLLWRSLGLCTHAHLSIG